MPSRVKHRKVPCFVSRYEILQILALTASHTHSARRPSAAALLTRSRRGGLTTPLAHSHTQTHTLSYGIAMGVYSLSLSLQILCVGRWGPVFL